MIRVNLLPGRRGVAPGGGASGSRYRTAAMVLAICLPGLAWAGWQTRALRVETARLDQATAAADRALQQLAPVAGRLAALEARRAQAAARAGVLEAWRRRQAAGGRLLVGVGGAASDSVQLGELRLDAEGIFVAGRATAVDAVSAFAANLEMTGAVLPPVEILGAQQDAVGAGLVRFELHARPTSVGE